MQRHIVYIRLLLCRRFVMGWESVAGKKYFYEILSVDGEKVRKFWGSGLEAQRAAARVEAEREARKKDLDVVRAWEKRNRVIDRKTDALDAFITLNFERVMLDAGFHRHKGEWRKKRRPAGFGSFSSLFGSWELRSSSSPDSLGKSNGTGSPIPHSRGISKGQGRKTFCDDSQGSTDDAEKPNGSVSPISLAREISCGERRGPACVGSLASPDNLEKSKGTSSTIPHSRGISKGHGQKTNMSEMNQSRYIELKADCLLLHQEGLATSESATELEDEVRRLSLEALRGLTGVEHPTLVCNVDATIAEITKKVQAIKEDFMLERSNAFDRMMLDQMTTAWVQWYVANWLLDSEDCLKRSHRQNQYLERRFSRAQVRLTKAIDQLARLRGIPRGILEKGKW